MRRSFLVALALFGCGDNSGADNPLAIKSLTDINADPAIVEVNLVATPASVEYVKGKRADVWAYRDGSIDGSSATVPGPLLEVNQGDQVIVHFTNQLPVATTIHWHGIRVPNDADGSDHTQTPVAPGETFEYVFKAVDSGTYWYHPHVRGDLQVERGLYAPLIVHGGTEPDVDADRMFVLDDIKLGADGNLDLSVTDDDIMFGRQATALLVNGQIGPTLPVHAGARERWRFVDAANSRFFKLALPGHPFLVIAWDGGIIPEPYMTDTLLIAPGERYEVIVDLDGETGSSLKLQTEFYDRAIGLPESETLDLMTLELGDNAPAVEALPTTWATLAPIPTDANTPTERFVFHEEIRNGQMAFSINGQVYPDVTPLVAAKDQIAIWSVNDDVGMDHPFHLHGMFFQVIDIDGVPAEHAGWKDTVIVPRYKTLRFAVRYGEPGHWMYHCHILEHQEGGMMGVLDVTP